METRKTLILIDGSNLTSRYKEMVKDGRVPLKSVIETDDYVWSKFVFDEISMNIVHIYYYSLLTANDEKINQVQNEISSIHVSYPLDFQKTIYGYSSMTPQIIKKSRGSHTNKSADDIHLVLDALRHTYNNSVDLVHIISGDGDYIPVIKEIMRQGKRVWVSALSSGLNPNIESAVDEFFILDSKFFEDEDYVQF